MQRRDFIHLTAYTAIALTLPFADSCTLSSPDKDLDQPSFFSHLVDLKAIKEAGKDYLKQFPDEDNRTKLSQLLLGADHLTGKKSIQKLLDDRVEKDFKAGKTVEASGWLLSITEARQCALYAILNT